MKIKDITVNIALPPLYDKTVCRFPVVYLIGEPEVDPIMQQIMPSFNAGCTPFILAGIEGKDWNTPFSPWSVPKLGKNLGPFAGGGPQFLRFLEQEIVPVIDKTYRTLPVSESRSLAGYSLAGLFTLYVLYNSKNFSRYACMSGSLWFPQWVGYVQSHTPAVSSPHIYLSLGDREKESRSSIMAAVEDCTQKTIRALEPYAPFFEFNAGGHFYNTEQRIVKGLLYIMRNN
jgi:uncharacterized protein